MNTPVYLQRSKQFLINRLEKLRKMASPCKLCPRHCKVDRSIGSVGFCNTGMLPEIASFGPHHGEEEPISGRSGSGTVFFTGCNMQCLFCQNFEISRGYSGHKITAEELAEIFMQLQAIGCHNINLVTPTHQLPAIIEALIIAMDIGLHIPIVYNTGGYEDRDTLKLLDGIIDIYMPDFKYSENITGFVLANTPDYPERVKASILEMHSQVGDLKIVNGIAVRGLLIRYLVLPGLIKEGIEIFRFIAEEVSRDTWINIMDQYRPAGDILKMCPDEYSSLCRRLNGKEYLYACQIASGYGLSRGFT